MGNNKCPICGEGRLGRSVTAQARSWSCGTLEVWKDDDGNPLPEPVYSTGTRCDRIVFRNGFLRCVDLLREVQPYLQGVPEGLRRRLEAEIAEESEGGDENQ